jgi:hypothetical protein
MAGFSLNQFQSFLNLLLNGTNYFTLFTTLPTDAENSNGVEVSGGSFERLATDALFPTATGNTTQTSKGYTQLANNASATFPTATGNWGNVVGWGFMSLLTGGTCLGAFPVTETPVDALYSQTGTTVTVNKTAHGLTTADKVFINTYNSVGVSGVYQVASVLNADSFTYTAPSSATITNAEVKYAKTKTLTVSTNDSVVVLPNQLTVAIKG